ncbi:uncharacterized protein LOC133728759 [Rosa rugosa]|uniref:uncharacterized protein LOC133728759 n=1 Tax=Rosa rugosa TaxID=74645 RepID=UPI002B4041ED|nr:uncharacterized protein LOC133728759 [Rosa rugosa]
MVHAKRPHLIFLSETLAQQKLIDTITARIGFSGNICVDKQPDCQRHAILWSPDLDVDVRTSSFHHIDVDVSEIGEPVSWRFTGIYGFAARGDRNQTWTLIVTLAREVCSLPWLMAGDFNEVWCREDKSRGIPRSAAAMDLFQRTMGNASLLEMGFSVGSLSCRHRSIDVQKQKPELKEVQEKLLAIMKEPYSSDQFEEQRRLHVKQRQLLALQEKYWRQRSRLKEGDRNSAFFHRRASNRRSKNTINGLLSPTSVWHDHPATLQHMLFDYYSQIFTREAMDDEAISTIFRATPMKVTTTMNEDLNLPYSDEENKAALFQMHLSKSPGPDDMSPFFYQKYWHIVGVDVCLAIRYFLKKGEIWEESNFTQICSIPKIKNLIEAAHFRPIALCNVIYRICSKVLANRLKRWLPDIVSPLQSAYVPGRLISDNTLVATEVAHFMHKLRTQIESFFSLKLDISKAYDRLEWPYLQAILTKLGLFPSLSALISQAMQYGNLKGLKMCPQAPVLHHLFFANDSLLFGAATMEEHMTVKCILNTYEIALGQKTNLASMLNVKCVDEHDRYLGLPLRVGRSKTERFQYLKEKVSKKLVLHGGLVMELKLTFGSINGCSIAQESYGGTGGVLRDSNGAFQAAFSKPVFHVNSAPQVELLAIKEGLQFIKNLQIQNAIIETDCLVAVQEITGTALNLSVTSNIVLDIQHELGALPGVLIKFAPRSCNRVAHKLVNLAFESLRQATWQGATPPCIVDLVSQDCNPNG